MMNDCPPLPIDVIIEQEQFYEWIEGFSPDEVFAMQEAEILNEEFDIWCAEQSVKH